MNMSIPETITDPTKRYDFLLLFDVTDGNPNGDPDAGNLPRIDPETMEGIVTDVCLKRKIRNYIDIVNQAAGNTDHDNGIFVRDSGVALNAKIRSALAASGEIHDTADEVPEEVEPDTEESMEGSGKAGKAGKAKGKKLPTRTSPDARAEMCRRFFDVRLFGGVLSTGKFVDKTAKSYVTCGQVRGPVQLTFARSVDPIIPGDIAITRVAITKEGESKDTEIGRKAQIPYGLYLGKGFFSPMLAADTGVSSADLELFWRAVLGMFEIDRSASRGHMELRGVFVFRHEHQLGNAPAGKLFDRLSVRRKDTGKPPRRFGDYEVGLSTDGLPDGVGVYMLVEP